MCSGRSGISFSICAPISKALISGSVEEATFRLKWGRTEKKAAAVSMEDGSSMRVAATRTGRVSVGCAWFSDISVRI